ncbi:hypothetical protein [Glycomyces sp. MUSA5-2]|uniref:hypothetical protein n=1 Tax=Glycomyces sp. MUSA5-2 TaxID=2053002 RepID=UPI00300A4A93
MSRQSRISQLKDLIDHPATSAEEREAAQRMLDRLMTKGAVEPASDRNPEHYDEHGRWLGSYQNRWYGSKATTEYAPATEIAAWMRADIKLARKVANAPAEDAGGVAIPSGFAGIPRGIRITVRTDSGTWTSSIDINVRNIPPAWGWYTAPVRDVYDRDWELRQTPTPELLRLVRELEEIHRAYNWDGSDIMTDYVDVRYYGDVRLVTDEHVAMPRRIDDAAIAEAAALRPPRPVAGVEDAFLRHVMPHFSSIDLEADSGETITLQARTIGDPPSAETDLGQVRRLAYRVVADGTLWFSGEYDWTVALPSPDCPADFYLPLITRLAHEAGRLTAGEAPQSSMSEEQTAWLIAHEPQLRGNLARWHR